MSETYVNLGSLHEGIESLLAEWDGSDFGSRIWDRDPTLWGSPDTPELADRLGWLTAHEVAVSVPSLEGINNVVLVGMGGSSLAPEVFSEVFSSTGRRLTVLDTTHPDAIESALAGMDLSSTVFVISSKSGGTVETLSLFRFFWSAVAAQSDRPGDHFIAVTDPGSGLFEMATDRGFRAVVLADPTVGGRYSALTAFGQVPGRLIGVNVDGMLRSADTMARRCGPGVAASDNPGLTLGAFMGAAALAGRDKLTVVCSESLQAFPVWLEQLVAESTGKNGRGILPVAGEVLGSSDAYGADRVFLRYALDGDHDVASIDERLDQIGAPVARIDLSDVQDLGGEIFRAEFATAAAGAALGIHPFDQPDVQAAKALANEAMSGAASDVVLPPLLVGEEARHAVHAFLADARPPDYVAVMAYIERTPDAERDLSWVQSRIRDGRAVATTVGFGPRFLHSTGQYHKGGPGTGLFIQVLDAASAGQQPDRLPVPETEMTFGGLIAAQVVGDAGALVNMNRRMIRVVVDDAGEFRSWFDA